MFLVHCLYLLSILLQTRESLAVVSSTEKNAHNLLFIVSLCEGSKDFLHLPMETRLFLQHLSQFVVYLIDQ